MSRNLLTASTALVVLGALLITAEPAQAQKFSLAPTLGWYIPTTELMKAIKGQSFEQEVGMMVGGRMEVVFSKRLGLQVTGSYVPSNLRFALDGTKQTTDASLFFGASKLSLFLLPPTSPISFQLNGGVALVKRGGAAYQDLKEKSSVGGSVGAQLGLRLGALPPLQFAVETYLYKQNLVGLINEMGEQTSQKDVQLSVGFGLPFGD
jgi:hypothetical protein